jgi:hypothetical protein
MAGDGKIKIDFAVSRDTDVAVYVENAKGDVVRHLVAGVLGKNPPPPLKPDSLEQMVEWDGKDDDGKPPVGGPFKARVALGLKVGYAGTAFSEKTGPDNLVDVMGLAVAPDGRLYVLAHRWQRYVAYSTAVHVFRRDGSYERTIKPFPSDLAAEKVKAPGAFLTREEGLVPLVYRSLFSGPSFYPNNDIQHEMTVTPDGKLILAVAPCNLAVLDSDGGIPNDQYAGPRLGNKGLTCPLPDGKGGITTFNIPYLAASGDGKSIYLTGIGNLKFIPNSGHHAFNDHALYRAPLPGRGPAEVVFGDPAAAGNDDKHLSDPRGVALDSKGHILVADFGNNRVVVLNEKDKTVAGTFPVEAPFWVAADPKSGAVYVGSKQSALVKFSGWGNAKEVARADFAALLAKIRYNRQGVPVHFALDSSAQPPVLWAGCGGALVRFEDQGGKFAEPQPGGAYSPIYPWNLSADPLRREVSIQGNGLRILNGETGTISVSRQPNFSGETFLMHFELRG